MKKVLALVLALVMLVASSVCAFAVSNNFVSSPTGQRVPTLILGENTDEDCFAWLEITGWADRHTIDEATREKMEEAYDQITSSDDLTDLCGDLADVADALGIPYSALGVSDLFDISWYGCDDHRDHNGVFEIKIQPEHLENFVALLHYHNGEWVLISNAEVTGDGDILSFSVGDLSPFAIIVNKGDNPVEPPFGGDTTQFVLYLVVMAVSGAALVVVGISIKKNRKGAKA
ncbi:MAG: hypothetical protein IKY44_06815 [Clostridia bacterium]|nr:hypothetical protein [Clostridia bacterium]